MDDQDNEFDELQEAYFRQVRQAYANKKISQSWYESLMDRFAHDHDELCTNVQEFIHAMIHAEYYITLERIEKGEAKIAEESDEKKKSEYRKLLNELVIKLEGLTPRGESA